MDFQYNKVTEITGNPVLKYQDQEDEDTGKEISLKEAQEKGSLYINTSSDPDHPKWTPVNSAMDKGILYIGPTREDLAALNKAREARLWGSSDASSALNKKGQPLGGGKRNKSRKPKRRNSRSKRRNSRSKRRKTLNKSRH